MKHYLNAEEKGNLVSLLAYKDGVDAIIGKVTDKQVKTYLRFVSTYLEKATQHIIKQLDGQEIIKLLTYSKKISVAPCYTDKAKREYKEMLAMDKVLPVETEAFYSLCEQTVEVCRVACKKDLCEQEKCFLRETMCRLDVPVANEKAVGQECPYLQREVGE